MKSAFFNTGSYVASPRIQYEFAKSMQRHLSTDDGLFDADAIPGARVKGGRHASYPSVIPQKAKYEGPWNFDR